MGASSSADHVPEEQKEAESHAASTGALPMLTTAFTKLSNPNTNTIPLNHLQDCLSLNFKEIESKKSSLPEWFPELLVNIGPAIVDQLFLADKEGIEWIEFLRGYIKCCGRMSSSMSLHTLFKLYATTSAKVGRPLKLEFATDEADTKISGFLMPRDVLMLLWVLWIMTWSSENLKLMKENDVLALPDINHLVFSAIESCDKSSVNLNIDVSDVSCLEIPLPAQKLHMWVLTTVPRLTHCFSQYVHTRLERCVSSEDGLDLSSSAVSDTSSAEVHDRFLLTCGRAWAISLTMEARISQVLKSCCPGVGIGALDHLLYRSSLHGRGMNRFWSNVAGYHAPLLILISANSSVANESDSSVSPWVIGVLTLEGFENKSCFYGNSAYLYSINPVFCMFSPSGKEKNFMYSHTHSTGRVYEPHPKPEGIGFGGTVGKERIFIDEDFAKVTIRHHAVDKTYHPGPLVPNQGFGAVEGLILEVEVWGLGGKYIREEQDSYKKREELFSEQRRTVDLKTFANWEDSPEKIMMDMMGDPNRVEREDR